MVCSSAVPIHDWPRVDVGTFHSHHLCWMAALSRTLNTGGLPDAFHALTGYATADGEPPPERYDGTMRHVRVVLNP